MENKSKCYVLVAWTRGGQLRMIPSLVKESSAPYQEKIDRMWEEQLRVTCCVINMKAASFSVTTSRSHMMNMWITRSSRIIRSIAMHAVSGTITKICAP